MTVRILTFSSCPLECIPHRNCRRSHSRQRTNTNRSLHSRPHLGSGSFCSLTSGNSVEASDIATLRRQVPNADAEKTGKTRQVTRMGNKSGSGPFTPLVIVARNILGKKDFNQLRGKAISLHSQVIKNFGVQIGADGKQVQGLIRLAKKNGEKLGFLS